MYWWGEVKLDDLNIPNKNMRGSDRIANVKIAVPTTGIRHLSIGISVVAILKENGKVTAAVRQNCQNGASWKQMSLTRKSNIVDVCVGAVHVVLLTEEGALLHWNSSDVSSIPKCPPNLQNRQVIQIACGDHHSVALSKDGQVFTWGQNSNGQLGLGKGEPSTLSPQPLKSLAGIPLSQISAGGDHSFALSLSGAVFGWGKNSAGQLGLGDLSDRLSPAPVVSLGQKKTISVSCGAEHTAILTKEGVVFTCGSGRYGQLGHNSLRDELRPRLVAELWGSKVSQIVCGRYHTLALIEPRGTIYTFGFGEQGQLGNGRTDNHVVPLPVNLLPLEQTKESTIKRVFAGANQSFAMSCPGQDWVTSCSDFDHMKKVWELDLGIAERWISSSSESWTKTNRNITEMLSSVSCINGSFLDKSSDKHYSTSEHQYGLDLSVVRQFFERLSQNEKVLKEVESVVQLHLLSCLSPRPAGVEGLRVYLILPELLRVLLKQNRGTDLAVSLAKAVLRLHPDSLRVLECYWSRIGYSFFRTVVKNFHSVASFFFKRLRCEQRDCLQPLRKTVEILQKLYAVNSQRHTRMKESTFYIKEINTFVTVVSLLREEFFAVFVLDSSWLSQYVKFYMRILKSLIAFPCIFDMDAKEKVFSHETNIRTDQYQMLSLLTRYATTICNIPPVFVSLLRSIDNNTLPVTRQTLLKDTFEYLQKDIHDFSIPLKVKFMEEDGADYGGVCQEFFRLFGKALISEDSKLLEIFEESGLVWFMSDEYKAVDIYRDIGTILGLALYNHCLVDIPFPLALFKKLLGIRPSLTDLEEMLPCEARSVKELLVYEEDVLEEMEKDFTWRGQDLIPYGRDVFVTKNNRERFVELYIDFVFNKSVARQFEAFVEGFGRACLTQTWKMFSPDELRVLICGEAEYAWEDLRKMAEYEGCESSDLLVQNFWEVLCQLSKEDQLKFLSFVYGTDRLPIGGLAKRYLKIVRLNMNNSDEHFPLANTCYGILQLPNYSSIDILRDKLTHAINYCDVFGMT